MEDETVATGPPGTNGGTEDPDAATPAPAADPESPTPDPPADAERPAASDAEEPAAATSATGAASQGEASSSGARVALLGLGTVGAAVAERLLDEGWRARAAARGHVVPRLVAVGVRDVDRERRVRLPEGVRVTTDIGSLVTADDVDVVVELMGGTEEAAGALRGAFAVGKPVVSANKELLARQGRELEAAAREAGVALRFEAAVGAGLPILGPLVRDLDANDIDSLRGIVNGTTNHILSTMASDAREYEDVLAEARSAGYVEADPRNDVEGLDGACKLALLIRLAFGGWPDVDAIRRDVPSFASNGTAGITGVTRAHLSAAARLGMRIKLVVRAERLEDGRVSAAATPMAVAAGSRIGLTGGIANIVEFTAEPAGRITVTGPGAGGPATSSAVLADLLALAGGPISTWGQRPPAEAIAIEDDLGHERGWLVTIEGVGVAGFPESVGQVSLATTDEAFVSRPMRLTELTARLGIFDRPVTLFPILSDA